MSFPWQPPPLAARAGPAAPIGEVAACRWRPRVGERVAALRAPRPELALLMALAALLNLWSLSQNGWANTYYSAAVRSMSTSWHNFLFASLDPSGVMTVDKPPLSLWVQALSVRVFGYHSLSVLVPQALMGVASVALLYDLVRRRFGRVGGFVAGFALAVTPITVAVSRHNNPDALLVLCGVAALWCTVRALDPQRSGPRMRWLVLAGVCVGLGFETKMGVALTVVPGITAAWLWVAPSGRGRLHALRELLAGGAAMTLVAGAWPALVELTPASQRPWVSGTSNNTVLSLIFGYNGLGRVEGQSGGPGGGAMFGGTPSPLRLLNQALGGQASWLLGFALVGGLAILASSRLRRSDARSGWLIAVGGALLVTGLLFSFAGGIFHPYYVSLLAPFLAALAGATAAQLIAGHINVRVVGPLAIAAGVAVELVIRSRYPSQLTWLPALLILAGVLTALALLTAKHPRVRAGAVALAVGFLLVAPSVWALDTLSHATSSTFPEGGPASALTRRGRPGGFRGGFGGAPGAARSGGLAQQLFGPGGSGGSAQAPTQGESPAPPPARTGGEAPFGALPGAPPAGGAPRFGGAGLSSDVLAYVKAHGGGTIAVSSQSSAASAIISDGAQVAGIGGFSGRESEVSVGWLAQEVRAGKIRWVLGSAQGQAGGLTLPGDTRTGSKWALAAVTQECKAVTLSSSPTASSFAAGEAGAVRSGGETLYDCSGRAAALEAYAAHGSAA
jgi:4-amino-4-deoxy-L-arabinose transferase-like glycosyltransferase